ncbi:MAG: hypothetical protein ABI889_03970 [Gemmatimonadota bacterium]
MASLLAVYVASAILSCAHATATTASHEPRAGALSADAIIAHYYSAIGGRDRLEQVDTRHMWGSYSEGSLNARTDIVWRRPSLRRVNVHAPGFDYSEGFDGETWEYSFQKKQLVVDSGAAADAGRRGAEFDESFVDYGKKSHDVELVGAELFADQPAHRLRVTLADGWQKEYVFDDSTGLVLALRKAMPLHATGAAITSITSYEDWRAEGGLLQPHRFVERDVQSGRLMNTLQWDSIRTNVKLSGSELGRPSN